MLLIYSGGIYAKPWMGLFGSRISAGTTDRDFGEHLGRDKANATGNKDAMRLDAEVMRLAVRK